MYIYIYIPPSEPDEPALQVQAVTILLPTGEWAFAGQLAQVSSPVAILYFPATHSVHVSPPEPVEPALQIHSVIVELPDGEVEWVGHVVHEVLPIEEYVPGEQVLHAIDVPSTLYVPGTQSVHSITSAVYPLSSFQD